MHIRTVQELWSVGINYTLDFEAKLAEFSPEITRSASTPEFQTVARDLEKTTASFQADLRSVLSVLGEKPQQTDNAIAKGMMQAVRTMIDLTEPGPVRDAAMIVELNQQQLYRVATYGSMLTYAKLLGRQDVVPQLEVILEESKRADATLSKLALEIVNPEAIQVR